MSKPRSLTTLAAVTLLALAIAGSAVAATPTLTDYGKEGSALSEVASGLLPAGFFSQPLDGPQLNRNNYVATFQPGTAAGLTLELHNPAKRDLDLVVAAIKAGGEATNFLVRIPAGAGLRLDAAAIAGAERVSLVALESFSASVAGAGKLAQNLEVSAPNEPVPNGDSGWLDDGKASGCSDAARNIRICANGGGCVTALAFRYVLYNPNPFTNQRAKAQISYPIQFPSSPTFHCSCGSSELGLGCVADAYVTYRCDGTPYTHEWQGLDETILTCKTSTATCVTGCTGSWTVTC